MECKLPQTQPMRPVFSRIFIYNSLFDIIIENITLFYNIAFSLNFRNFWDDSSFVVFYWFLSSNLLFFISKIAWTEFITIFIFLLFFNSMSFDWWLLCCWALFWKSINFYVHNIFWSFGKWNLTFFNSSSHLFNMEIFKFDFRIWKWITFWSLFFRCCCNGSWHLIWKKCLHEIFFIWKPKLSFHIDLDIYGFLHLKFTAIIFSLVVVADYIIFKCLFVLTNELFLSHGLLHHLFLLEHINFLLFTSRLIFGVNMNWAIFFSFNNLLCEAFIIFNHLVCYHASFFDWSFSTMSLFNNIL